MILRALLLSSLVLCTASFLLQELSHRRRAARVLVRIAGSIQRNRRAEFSGELAMLQETPSIAGIGYAVGAMVGATIEAASVTRKPIRIEQVSKAFGDRQAVRGVSLEIPAGSITALLGGNGAGKSTLINLLAGVHAKDGGSIYLDGIDIERPGVRDGIAIIPHDIGLFDDMTVSQNLSIFRGVNQAWLIRPDDEYRRAEEALKLVGADIDPRALAGTLNRADQRLVAIARALMDDCRLLVLDEPSASLPQDGVGRLFCAMDALRRRGISMIFVSHRIDEVFQIADRIAVLRDGTLVHDESVDDSTPDEVFLHITGMTSMS